MKPVYTLFTLATLGSLGVWPLALPNAQADTPAAPKSTPAKPVVDEKPKEGEVRLDGKITVMMGAGQWTIEAVSWMSPTGKTTDFDEAKSKTVALATDAYLHPVGEADKVALVQVKIGAHVAVIGKNQPDGTLKVREVVLLEGYGSRHSVGVLMTNPETSRLVDLSRAARDAGQIPKAIQYAIQAVDAAQGMRDTSGEALATQDLGNLYLFNKESAKALQAYSRGEVLGHQLSSPLVLGLSMTGRASILRATDHIDDAIKVLEEADPITAQAPPEVHIKVLSLLGMTYMDNNQPRDAVAVMERVAPLEVESGKTDDSYETRAMVAILRAKTDPDTAKDIVAEVSPRIAGIADDKVRADTAGALGVAQWRLDDKDAAQASFARAAKTLSDTGKEGAKRWRNMAANLELADDDWPKLWAAFWGATLDPEAGDKKPDAGDGDKDGNE